MSDILSQEELDALLSEVSQDEGDDDPELGEPDPPSVEAESAGGGGILTQDELDGLLGGADDSGGNQAEGSEGPSSGSVDEAFENDSQSKSGKRAADLPAQDVRDPSFESPRSSPESTPATAPSEVAQTVSAADAPTHDGLATAARDDTGEGVAGSPRSRPLSQGGDLSPRGPVVNDGHAQLSPTVRDSPVGGQVSRAGPPADPSRPQVELADDCTLSQDALDQLLDGTGARSVPVAESRSMEPAPTPTPPVKQTEPDANLQLILSIPVDISVELGRTRMSVSELLELGQGSLVELSRVANDLIDLTVNRRVMARGEVVVVGESFGFRVVEVDTVRDRIRKL